MILLQFVLFLLRDPVKRELYQMKLNCNCEVLRFALHRMPNINHKDSIQNIQRSASKVKQNLIQYYLT
jgi:hypothetical protein